MRQKKGYVSLAHLAVDSLSNTTQINKTYTYNDAMLN
jgi:hypothetical protein